MKITMKSVVKKDSVAIIVEDEKSGSMFYVMPFMYLFCTIIGYDSKCRLNKQLVVVADVDEIVRNPFRENPNLRFETEGYCAYGGDAVASAILDIKGEIHFL